MNQWSTRNDGALAGLRIVELGRYIAAPFAGRLLADWGAEVIKIEAPSGDPMRWGPGGERTGFSPVFTSFNRGKRSVTLDLKSDDGRAVLQELLERSDALLHNLRPAALARLGVDPDTTSTSLTNLVVVGINGFGANGPFADAPTFDSVVSAVSGLYAQLGAVDDLAPAGPPWSDLLTGMFAAQATLAALLARDRGRGGQVVDVAMLESVLSVVDDACTTWSEAGTSIKPRTRQARQHVFMCCDSDGLPFIAQVASAEPMWRRFIDLVDPDGIGTDDRFATYGSRIALFDELAAAVAKATIARPRDRWIADLAALDICAGPVNSIAEVADDPRVQTSGGLVDATVPGGPTIQMTRPVGTFGKTSNPPARRPPEAGEDTLAVLEELGIDAPMRKGVESTWSTRRTER